MSGFSKLPRSTQRLFYFLGFITIYFLVVIGFFVTAGLTKNEVLAIIAGIGMISFLVITFYTAAIGILIFGILSIIRKETIIKVPGGIESVDSAPSIVYGIAYTLVGIIFLSGLISLTYATFCYEPVTAACKNMDFVNIPGRILFYINEKFPWIGKNFSLVVGTIALITIVIVGIKNRLK